MYADLAEKLRLDKIEASKNEISCENLVKPSELLKRQRSARKKTPEKDHAVSEQNERQIEQRVTDNDRLSGASSDPELDENMNSIQNGKIKSVRKLGGLVWLRVGALGCPSLDWFI